ncbi:7-deoxyloganetin glucosyltransferase-like [Syzygium oleosum]|uniref:7-deoxyloganetin glucosyltransferase-like n=1 Tax=Syzygium oleosum TaxID=219896 RepID=UPI0011D293AF|nr:7-deoxyloganetin glucosyltransferase-like [Syzygium oleosum]
MDTQSATAKRSHAVCVPAPYQSHIGAMLKLAKLLHTKGFDISFVNTEHNHRRLLKSRGPRALDGFRGFQFLTITDGLPPKDADSSQDALALCDALRKNMSAPFSDLISNLNHTASNSDVPPVTCIFSDGFMSFATNEAAQEFGIPIIHLWTIPACAFMGFQQYRTFREKGLTPLKDTNHLTNGYLDTVIDWIPGLKDIRLWDLPTLFPRSRDPDDILFNFCMDAAERANKASAMIFHTFDALESELLNALSSMFPRIYAIGPLSLLLSKLTKEESPLKSIDCNLWREDTECLRWLASKEPKSVLYVNFGSMAVLTREELIEFAMGLADSKHPFLWIIRPNLVSGNSAVLPREFMEEIEGRSMLASWCPQEAVLNHLSIGGFLTHCGWNSIIESVSAGVPMICWPSVADQRTNCTYACSKWEIGLELSGVVKREEVERLVRELMAGDKGKQMKERITEWKKQAQEATDPNGSSSINFDKLLNELLVSN